MISFLFRFAFIYSCHAVVSAEVLSKTYYTKTDCTGDIMGVIVRPVGKCQVVKLDAGDASYQNVKSADGKTVESYEYRNGNCDDSGRVKKTLGFWFDKYEYDKCVIHGSGSYKVTQEGEDHVNNENWFRSQFFYDKNCNANDVFYVSASPANKCINNKKDEYEICGGGDLVF